MKLETLSIGDIRIDGGTQSRASVCAETVREYAEALTDGAKLPPVVVFFDGAAYWLADGFHRLHANRQIGAAAIEAEVRDGTVDDAIVHSCGANQTHGLRRSNEDKRRSVLTMLAKRGDWSDNRIAKHVGVDHKTVSAHRASILGNSQDAAPSLRTVERNGKTYQQNTANVGKAAAAPTKEQPLPAVKPEAPAAAPQPAATPAQPEPDEDDGEDLHQMLLDMQRECEDYARRLADWERAMAADGREALVTAIKRYEHAEREKALSDERAAMYQKQRDQALQKLKAIGRAVGEADPDKVVRAVQALAKTATPADAAEA